eukprot:7543881-Pyramimonas_sp.AAC.1
MVEKNPTVEKNPMVEKNPSKYCADFRGEQIKSSKSDAKFQNLIRERGLQMEGGAGWAEI